MPTSKFTDPQHLRTKQYRYSTNLEARIFLHERFSTNPYGWQLWVFDQLEIPPNGRVLEVGCGPGNLWRENQYRLPKDWRLLLSDLSTGMLQKARNNLLTNQYRFSASDVQNLPFPSDHFDVVIANHMLYHVPDRKQAIGEIKRVLQPGGRFYAATNGDDHLQEIYQLTYNFDPRLRENKWSSGFSLENGMPQLKKIFSKIELHLYEDGLVVTESEPLAAYIASMTFTEDLKLSRDRIEELNAFINLNLTTDGPIHITKSPGLFIAERG